MALSDVVGPGIIAAQVTRITGNPSDGAAAAGYSAWVNSITGSEPQVMDIGGGRARMILSKNQVKYMQDWLDSRVKESIIPGPQKAVEYELGPVFGPWSAKYVIIVAGAGILAGMFLGKIL